MFNQCSFIGNLAKDVEIRHSQNGSAVASFTVACNEKWNDKSGQQQEHTEWVRATAFGRLAEVCGDFLQKGHLVFIQGKMKTDKWQDSEGNDRYSTGIIVREMKMLGSRREERSDRQRDIHEPSSTGDSVPF